MTTALLIVSIVLTLALAAFCAGAETGFLSVSRERILHLSREGGKKAKLVQAALSDMGRTTTTLLIGNNLAAVAYSASAAAISDNAVWSFFAAFTVLYVSEFMPKLLCASRPLRRILFLAPAYRVMAALLRPLASAALAFTDLFVPRRESKYKLTVDDLLRILQDRKDGVCLSDTESALITRIVVLRAKGKPITPEAIMEALRQ